MGDTDPAIAFVDNPVADHQCLCDNVEGIQKLQAYFDGMKLETFSMDSTTCRPLDLEGCRITVADKLKDIHIGTLG